MLKSRRSQMFELAQLMVYESVKRKQLMFVSVDGIYAPTVVIPTTSIGRNPGSMLKVDPQQTWPTLFTFLDLRDACTKHSTNTSRNVNFHK